MVYRITPSLGPDLEQKATAFYWDLNNVSGAGVQRVSYQLGSKVVGSDAHEYVLVKAAGTIAAGTDVTIDENTWVATAGAGTYEVPPTLTGGVVVDQFFHARKIAI